MKTELRFFIDLRAGCGAIIDRKHIDYDKDYPGLHHETGGVVEYRHGFQNHEKNCWDMREYDVNFLNNECDILNKCNLEISIDDPTTQLTEVLHALLTNETITVNSIMSELKIINLSARISDLRHDHGLRIPCVSIHTLNKWKRHISYGSWHLEDTVKGLKLYNKLNKKK